MIRHRGLCRAAEIANKNVTFFNGKKNVFSFVTFRVLSACLRTILRLEMIIVSIDLTPHSRAIRTLLFRYNSPTSGHTYLFFASRGYIFFVFFINTIIILYIFRYNLSIIAENQMPVIGVHAQDEDRLLSSR